jgi:glucosamine--fructose-6-phosphate aminotransferase (isomerizing)
VSQSGETADTLGALAVAKQHNAFCVALTNVVYSSISKLADLVLPVCAGPEIAVASTKAYVCQLTALYILASHIKNQLQNKNIDFLTLTAKFIIPHDKQSKRYVHSILPEV